MRRWQGWGGTALAALRHPWRALRARRGSVMLLFGLGVFALFLCIGLAVDLTRLWLLRARLQSAVDAAVLQAVAANEDASNNAKATTDASNLFWTNFGRTRSAAGSSSAGCPSSTINWGFMNATVCGNGLTVSFPDTAHAQVQATASLPTTIMAIRQSAVLATASAVAQRAGGVEVSLVLDTSRSMGFAMDDGTGNDKLTSLKAAANNMLAALYGGGNTVPNLWVSVVPFAGAVNVGNSHTSWLNSTFTSATFAGRVENDNTGQGWRGCVEARQGGLDLTEDGPSSRFAPFYWPTTNGQYGSYTGDNDWTNANITDTRTADQSSGFTRGPNLGCPHNAILPPTANRATVANAISALAPTGPIGTVVVQGLQWGWFTVSPYWQGSGGWNLTNQAGAPLPLSYSAPNNKKVIVLMTDGTTDVSGPQTWWGPAHSGSSFSPNCGAVVMAPSCIRTSVGKSAGWANSDADTWYSPYGRASAGRIAGMTPANTGNAANDSEQAVYDMSRALDNKTAQLCTNIKAQGVIIYTIFFHSDWDDYFDYALGARAGPPGARSILLNCATDANHFFEASSTSSINTVFVSIAQQISALRLQQ